MDMVNLDSLIWKREYIPIIKDKRIEIPPYHPSIAKNGIDFQSVPNLINEIIEAAIMDLNITNQTKLEDIRSQTKKIEIVRQSDSGLLISNIPISSSLLVGSLWVGKDEINPYGYNGDQGININPKYAAQSFNVPINITFPPELMQEYIMKEEFCWEALGIKNIACPNLWYRHNLASLNAVFYKNLVMALNNEVVRKKYSDKISAPQK